MAESSDYGTVRDVITELNALTLQAKRENLPAIQKLAFVSVANPDAERKGISPERGGGDGFYQRFQYLESGRGECY